jgi:HlyD family secretion protein
MNPEKLKELHIQAADKERPQGSIWIIFLGVALATGVALYLGWPREKDTQRVAGYAKDKPAIGSAPKAANTNDPAPAKPGDFILTVSGYIINRERIELSPRFIGLVKWIGVKKGDAVTNGQVVVLLDDAEYKARLHETQGRLAHAQVAVAKSELDYKRAAQLVARNVEMQKAEDDARLQLDAARAQVKEIEGQIELIRTYLDWTIIRSTIDGVVLEKLVDAGELVTPQSFGGGRGPSTAFLAVADPKDLQVEIDLNEADLSKISMNQKCRVTPEAYQDKSYEGYVAEIAPEANRQKGTLQVKVQIREPDRFLTPELSARVDFLK